MGCEHKEGGGVYHPRQPQQTPFYQLAERFYPQFEAVYEQRYQNATVWRPIIGTASKVSECDQQGFAGCVVRLRARILRGVFCRGVFVSQLPSEAGLANGALGET